MYGSEPEILRSEMEESSTGAPSKDNGKSVSVERQSGECYHWKAKGQCTRGGACSFRHDVRKNVKNQRVHPLVPLSRRRKAMEKLLRCESLSETGVRLVEDIEDLAKATSV